VIPLPRRFRAGLLAHDVRHAGRLAKAYGPLVVYDAQAESTRLIADGLPDRPVTLSRRRRFAPVAVDVDDDIACTRFVRRGVGCFWDETHLLAREHTSWRLLGGGGASSGKPPDPRLPWGGRWLRAAELLVGRSVAVVLVDGRRRLPVPYHGRLVVVWASRRPPRVSARDAAGHELASVAPSTGRLPSRYVARTVAAPAGSHLEPHFSLRQLFEDEK
jgi:hypothetical protein